MKIYVIIFSTLIYSISGFAEDEIPIKHKRIECSSKDWPGRHNNHFLIISENDKSAELTTIPWNEVKKFKAVVTKDIGYIYFKFEDDRDKEYWQLRRSDGKLEQFVSNLVIERNCESFSKNLDPEKFLNSQLKLRKENRIKENKF